MFESIAKTNTTHIVVLLSLSIDLFESIAKTNTTHISIDKVYNIRQV